MKTNLFNPILAVESITYGERVTKYVSFNEIPKRFFEMEIIDIDAIIHYILENYLLKSKRPFGIHDGERFLLIQK